MLIWMELWQICLIYCNFHQFVLTIYNMKDIIYHKLIVVFLAIPPNVVVKHYNF